MELLDFPGVIEVVSSATQDIPSNADDVVSSATHVLVNADKHCGVICDTCYHVWMQINAIVVSSATRVHL